MALESEGMGTTMLVQPSNSVGNGFGGFGGDGWWILLLFILLGGNGFGNGGNGLYPWMNQSNQIDNGFRDQMLNSNISGIRSDITNVASQICNGFNQTELALLNQGYTTQTALQNCCCENRASIADLKYTVATENCADRAALADALRSVIEANNASTQRILDQMCADKIDAKNEKIAELQRELQMAQLSASQKAQTQSLLADNALQTAALESWIRPTPIPAYIVANPNTPATTTTA